MITISFILIVSPPFTLIHLVYFFLPIFAPEQIEKEEKQMPQMQGR